MKMNYKHLGLYVLAGIFSAGVCNYTAHFTSSGWSGGDSPVFLFYPIWLAIVILVIGDYVSGMRCRSDWFSPLVLIAMCAIGWCGAYMFGFFVGFDQKNIYDTQLIGSGVIGGICVAIGLALAWKLNQILIVITTITLAGLLGGLILLIDWEALLFWVWQPILLLGIGIAVQIDSAKSPVESDDSQKKLRSKPVDGQHSSEPTMPASATTPETDYGRIPW